MVLPFLVLYTLLADAQFTAMMGLSSIIGVAIALSSFIYTILKKT
jgi:hypothetical protein